jgi:PST family polysaccharide transporter
LNLYNKSLSGIKWNFIINSSIYIINIIQFIVVARYLSDNDFGIVGIVAPMLVGLLLMSDMGFGAAIIQKKTDNIAPYASSILIIMLLISSLLGALLILSSDYILTFYNISELKMLIYYVALVLIVKSYSIVIVSLSHRNYNFKEEALSRFIGAIVGFIISLVLAVIYNSYWALLINNIILPVFAILYLNYKLSYTRIKFRFYFSKVKEVFGFALTLFIAKIIYFFTRSGIGLILGKFYAPALYGQFYFAQRTSEYPKMFFGGIINSVVYTSLSAIQNDEEKFKRQFLIIGSLVTFFTAPICIYLLFYSQEIIYLVFGNKWNIAVDIFSYFMFFVLISTIGSIPSMAIQAKGKPKILLNANLIRIPFIMVSLYYGISNQISLNQIAFLLIISELVPILYLIFKSLRILNISLNEFIKYYFLHTIFIIFIILAVNYSCSSINFIILKLTLVLIFSGFLYLVINYLFNRTQFSNILIVTSDITNIKYLKVLGVQINVK